MLVIETPTSSLPPSKTIRILIVEDERIIAINLQEYLESLGYEVLAITSSGREAIAKATELLPNLILMDIRIKGEMDGIQTAEQIWDTLHIPVIYLTGHSDQNTLDRAKVTAPFGYLLKPIKEKELYIAIETALQRYEREQLLLAVFKNMGDGVIVADLQNRVQFLNRIAEQLTGWNQKDAKNQTLTHVFNVIDGQTQESIGEQLVTSALQQDLPIYIDKPLLLTSKQGATIPIADSITSFKNNQGENKGVVVVFRDDTQRLLAEERNLAIERARQLELQMAEQQRLIDLKEEFLATVSHDLRTPLANIRTTLRLLEMVLDQEDAAKSNWLTNHPSIVRYLNVINEQCERQIDLVNDLLEMREVDANLSSPELNPAQLQDWIPHVLEGFQQRAQLQQQSLRIDIPSNLPSFTTELSSLTRILSELVHNACKYTPAGEQIVVIVRVSQSENWSQTVLQIQVSNSGVEIPPAEWTRIFEPFYRITSRDLRKQGGTGLGLSLVKKLVTRLQGTINVTSEFGWTTFTILLPWTT
jgi:PAS domain S-box-containing protein